MCPKCGFSQPPDQFCASCGVDMTHYKPRLSRIFKNAYLHFTTLSLVIGAGLFYIYQANQQRELLHHQALHRAEEDRLALEDDFLARVNSRRQHQRQYQHPNAKESVGDESDQPEYAAAALETAATDSAAEATGEGISGEEPESAPLPKQVSLTFVRVEPDLFANTAGIYLDDGTQAVTLTSAQMTALGFKSKGESRDIDLNENGGVLRFQKEIRSYEVTVQMAPLTASKADADLAVEVLRLARGKTETDPIVETILSQTMKVPYEGAAIITGLIPPKENKDETSTPDDTVAVIQIHGTRQNNPQNTP